MNKIVLNNSIFWLLAILSFAGYFALGYHIERTDFYSLLVIFGGLFFIYYLYIKNLGDNYKTLIYLGILFRLLMIFVYPNLSDDLYRFVWDGRLINSGYNPFMHLPSYYIDNNIDVTGLDPVLFSKLNSPDYYTIYPPILQFIFSLACWLFPSNIYGSVLVMKSFIFLSEIGTIFLLVRLLKEFDQHPKFSVLYALNPLVIIELCGNLHFEALMIFFTLLAVYFLRKEKLHFSATSMTLAICSKLLPLMFLPFLMKRLGLKKSISYFFTVGFGILLLFTPFLSKDLFLNLYESIDLYFQKFEFNASIYYVVRWIGFQVKGWNIIQTAGPILSLITLVIILALALTERILTYHSLLQKIGVCLLIYFSFATIVHPWYITSLVAFAPFWNWRFPIVWSALIVLSYWAYSSVDYAENLWLVGAEYIGVILFLFTEWRMGWNNNVIK